MIKEMKDYSTEVTENTTEKKFMTVKQIAEKTGFAEYRVRKLCKEGKVRHNMAGNKIILRLSWFLDDVEKLANKNLAVEEEPKRIGVLRQIK